MKVYDMHVHYLGGKMSDATSDAESFLQDMDANSIALSLLLPNDGLYCGCPSPNEDNDLIASVATAHPERFVGYGVVQPRDAGAADEVVRCVTKLGLQGIKLHPWLQGFSVFDPAFDKVAEAAAALNTTLFFHDGTPPYTETLQIAHLAHRYPNLRIVMGHCGLNDLWNEAILACRRYENIWLCTCGCSYLGLQAVAQALDGERLMFGSDYPLGDVIDTRDRIRRIELLNIDDDAKERILWRNGDLFLAAGKQDDIT